MVPERNRRGRALVSQTRRALLLVVFAGSACSRAEPAPVGSPAASAAPAVPAQAVRIGLQKYGVLIILKARGTLDKALAAVNSSAEWSEFFAGPPLMEALGAGKVDFGVAGEGPPVFAQAAGAPLVYVAAEPPAPEAEAILVPKDSTLSAVTELKGKKIALNKGSNVHFFTLRALEEAGLEPSDVKLSFLPPADARAAFESGQVDAWTIWDPYLAAAEKATGARVLRDAKGLAKNPAYYVGARSFVEKRGDLVKVILEEINKIDVWARDNPREVAALLADQLKIDVDALEIAIRRGTYGAGPITDELMASQQLVADTYFKAGLIPKAIRIADAVLARNP
jgi:sulfonate transport system substrate-binding protein